jgi:hypothetical protein
MEWRAGQSGLRRLISHTMAIFQLRSLQYSRTRSRDQGCSLHVANDRRGFRHDVVDEINSGAEFVALDAREDFGDDALVVDGALGVYGSLGAHTDWCSLSLWLAPVVWCAPPTLARSGVVVLSNFMAQEKKWQQYIGANIDRSLAQC